MLVRILERIAKAVGWGFAVSIGVGAISGVVHGVLVACMDKPESPENIAFAVQWGRATALIGTLAGFVGLALGLIGVLPGTRRRK
jgi:hypothetical protein